MNGARPVWWLGLRGEWYVAAQFVLLAVVFFGPRTLPGLPEWPASLTRASVIAGIVLMVAGGCLLFAGTIKLGANLTPMPYPKEHATLIQTGPYGLVRHPLYAGVIMGSFGWAFAVRGWLTVASAAVLLVILEIKSAREERWLVDKFPEYLNYQKRVRKLIPFIH